MAITVCTGELLFPLPPQPRMQQEVVPEDRWMVTSCIYWI